MRARQRCRGQRWQCSWVFMPPKGSRDWPGGSSSDDVSSGGSVYPPVAPTRVTPRMFRGATDRDARSAVVLSPPGVPQTVEEHPEQLPRFAVLQGVRVAGDTPETLRQARVGLAEQ